jgi:N-acetyl-gamma-glutamyl-phosphate reductase
MIGDPIKKIKAGIIGSAGYTGGELLRILLNHPSVEIAFAQSRSNAGALLSSVHADLVGETELKFVAEHDFEIDVLFFCAGHGEAKKFVDSSSIPATVKLIDIGNDFRLERDSVIAGREFIYGLPELNREVIRSATAIANPGCFATAIQLGLLPLASKSLLTEVYTTGITGSTGAGQSLAATSHFSWRSNNIQAYKTLTHQHLGEINQSLNKLQPGFAPEDSTDLHLSFVPWRGDFARGIFVSSQLNCEKTLDELNELFTGYFTGHPFVSVSKDPIHLKQVVNTNKAVIQLEKVGKRLVVHSAIDNLLKGASGQAVQNMNLMFGIDEITGLKFKASAF